MDIVCGAALGFKGGDTVLDPLIVDRGDGVCVLRRSGTDRRQGGVCLALAYPRPVFERCVLHIFVERDLAVNEPSSPEMGLRTFLTRSGSTGCLAARPLRLDRNGIGERRYS